MGSVPGQGGACNPVLTQPQTPAKLTNGRQKAPAKHLKFQSPSTPGNPRSASGSQVAPWLWLTRMR